jgi:ElaB/YqjD/DUF883 family membrane-anchored ribosome-binding protein
LQFSFVPQGASPGSIQARVGQQRGIIMADRTFDKVARDLSSDFQALRDDVRRLTSLVSDLATDQTESTRSSLMDSVDKARGRFSDTADRWASQASNASDRVRGAGAEIEQRIEKNPMTAIMIAIVGGLLIGAMSRSRR